MSEEKQCLCELSPVWGENAAGQIICANCATVKKTRFKSWEEMMTVLSLLLNEAKQDYPLRWEATKIFLIRDLSEDLAKSSNMILDATLQELMDASNVNPEEPTKSLD